MTITQAILDELTEKAKALERLRMAMDLRNSPEDQSQRMLNALEPGTVLPIHRHHGSSEAVVSFSGRMRRVRGTVITLMNSMNWSCSRNIGGLFCCITVCAR